MSVRLPDNHPHTVSKTAEQQGQVSTDPAEKAEGVDFFNRQAWRAEQGLDRLLDDHQATSLGGATPRTAAELIAGLERDHDTLLAGAPTQTARGALGLLQDMLTAINGSNIAYKLIESPPTIIPRTSPEEVAAIGRALQQTETETFRGARQHLVSASSHVVEGNYHDAIRESIHAVESVARTLDDGASTTLKPALDALEKKHHLKLHPALKKAMEGMYGYTSDQDGIRHSLLDEPDAVDETDAIFMLGACASFVSYLIGKSQDIE